MKTAAKKAALRRLRIAAGQMRGLIAMVEGEQYCIDVITQSSAVKEALSAAERIILEGHLTTHVAEQMRSGKKKKAVDEIVKVYRLAQKKK